MEKKKLSGRRTAAAAVIALVLAGCGGNAAVERGGNEAAEETPTLKATPTPEPTTEADPTAAPTPTPEEEPAVSEEWLEMYAPVLQETLDLIRNGYDDERQYIYISTGVVERVNYSDGVDLLDSIGYVIEDISGDGIPELLIGENMSYEENGDPESHIYGLHSVRDRETFPVLDGWARNSWLWMGDGYFLNSGSGGAMHSIFGQCHLSRDGIQLEWDDYYFSDEKDGKIAFFHNQNGRSEQAASTELDISEEEFWKLKDEFKTQNMLFTPMRDFMEKAATMDEALLMPEREKAVLGSWSRRSFADAAIVGYKMFSDHTWLAVENPSMLSAGQTAEDKPLSGTWQAVNGGVDYYAFELYPEDGSASVTVEVYTDEYGDRVLNFGGDEFYNDGAYEYKEITGTWLFPRGDSIVFDENGDWLYYDDEGNWMFGGHSVIEGGPNGIYLRLHTPFGDTGNIIFGRGVHHDETAGYPVIDMEFNASFEMFVGKEATLSPGR